MFPQVRMIAPRFEKYFSFFSILSLRPFPFFFGGISRRNGNVTLSCDLEKLNQDPQVKLLIEVKVDPGWHVLENAGQSGYPTTIEWNTVKLT